MTSRDTADQALPLRAVRELAAATAALVGEHDVIGTITNLMSGCVASVGASAAGIVITQPGGVPLEFLAATDHRAEHLELYQVQLEEGPAMDCVSSAQLITVMGLDQLAARWPTMHDPFSRAGFVGVRAVPMLWQGLPLGSLNLFFAAVPPDADDQEVSQAFADVAALIILHAHPIPPDQVAARTMAALEERAVIEQAKGVLADTDQLAMDAAFDRLIELARSRRLPVTVVAADIIDRAANGDRPQP